MAYPLEGQVCAHRKRTLLEMKGPIQLSMVRPPAGQRLVDPAATAPEPSKNTWSVPAGQVRPQMTYPLPSTFGPGVTLSPVSCVRTALNKHHTHHHHKAHSPHILLHQITEPLHQTTPRLTTHPLKFTNLQS
ncbi:hypothetical protein PMIN06_002822 [Paraphaeosphaeria minitans]